MTAIYSTAHFFVDFSCAFLLFRTLSDTPDFAVCLLVYNFCAFALQMPLGLLADRLNRNALVAASGCVLTALAYGSALPLLTAVTAGVGNALFHLGGGLDTLNISQVKAAALGVFVAPGALGLWFGTLLAQREPFPLWPAPLVLAAAGAAIMYLARRTFGSMRTRNAPLALCGKAQPLLPLFLVVVLRSCVGMELHFPWTLPDGWALLLPLAAVLGKAAGGFLTDGTGPLRATVLSLGLSAIFSPFSASPLFGLLAVFFFHMTMPLTLWAAARCLPGCKGFAFGLLTFALFLGYLPRFLGWHAVFSTPWSCAAAALLSLALLYPLLRHQAVTVC